MQSYFSICKPVAGAMRYTYESSGDLQIITSRALPLVWSRQALRMVDENMFRVTSRHGIQFSDLSCCLGCSNAQYKYSQGAIAKWLRRQIRMLSLLLLHLFLL